MMAFESALVAEVISADLCLEGKKMMGLTCILEAKGHDPLSSPKNIIMLKISYSIGKQFQL